MDVKTIGKKFFNEINKTVPVYCQICRFDSYPRTYHIIYTYPINLGTESSYIKYIGTLLWNNLLAYFDTFSFWKLYNNIVCNYSINSSNKKFPIPNNNVSS